jgi:hypothetical protein
LAQLMPPSWASLRQSVHVQNRSAAVHWCQLLQLCLCALLADAAHAACQQPVLGSVMNPSHMPPHHVPWAFWAQQVLASDTLGLIAAGLCATWSLCHGDRGADACWTLAGRAECASCVCGRGEEGAEPPSCLAKEASAANRVQQCPCIGLTVKQKGLALPV